MPEGVPEGTELLLKTTGCLSPADHASFSPPARIATVILDDVGHEGRIPHNGETVRTQRGLMLEKEPQDLREVMVFVRGTRHGIQRCGECGSLAANIFAGPVFFRSGLD
jgi:hypothetical protein